MKKLIEVAVPDSASPAGFMLSTLDDTEANRASGTLLRAWFELADGREVSVVHFFPLSGPTVFPLVDEYAPMLVWFAQRQGDYLVLMQAMAGDDVRNSGHVVVFAPTVQDAAKYVAIRNA